MVDCDICCEGALPPLIICVEKLPVAACCEAPRFHECWLRGDCARDWRADSATMRFFSACFLGSSWFFAFRYSFLKLSCIRL